MFNILLFFILSICITFSILELCGINKLASRILSIIPLSILFIIVCFNRSNTPDYFDYKNAFDYEYFIGDIGYFYLTKYLKGVGFSFDVIFFIMSILIILVIYLLARKTSFCSTVILFYVISVLIVNITQIRNTIMYLIIMLSLSYIWENKRLKHYFFVALAVTFHKFAIIYTPFYYLCSKERKKFNYLLLAIVLLSVILAPIAMKVFLIFLPEKMSVYLERRPDFGIIIVFAYVVFDLITILWIDSKTQSHLNDREKRISEVLFRFVFYSIIILPFSFYFLEVKRMQRNAMLAKFIYSAIALGHMSSINRFITIVLLLVSSIMPLTVMIYENNLSKFLIFDNNTILNTFFK